MACIAFSVLFYPVQCVCERLDNMTKKTGPAKNRAVRNRPYAQPLPTELRRQTFKLPKEMCSVCVCFCRQANVHSNACIVVNYTLVHLYLDFQIKFIVIKFCLNLKIAHDYHGLKIFAKNDFHVFLIFDKIQQTA